MLHLDQRERQEEQAAAQRRIEQQREQVGAREIAHAKQMQRQHRRAGAQFPDDEQQRGRDAQPQGAQHGRRLPVLRRRLDEGIDDAAQAERGQQRAAEVQAGIGGRAAAFGHAAPDDPQDQRRDRQVDQKGPDPRVVVDQIAAQQRSDGRGDAARARPGADGRATPLFRKTRADQRQTAWHQQRTADALHRACRDQLPHVAGQRAAERGQREQRHAQGEHAAPPEAVAQRAADQQQRREEEGIGLDHPLRLESGGAQVGLDRRQRDVDHRAVDKGHARTEDRRQQHAALGSRRAGRRGAAVRDGGFVAGQAQRLAHGSHFARELV